MYSFNSLESAMHYDEYFGLDETLYDEIRSKIAGLSRMYRDIIVLHYYDNLSCREISQRLGIPEGTVTWRLSEGRKKLKKECMDMTEQALRPVKMSIRIHGNGNYNGKDIPFPWTYIDDALSQNILYHCYREPQGVEDLSKLCGVPAYYIEDTLKRLLDREAIIEPTKGRYLTDFIIYGQEHTAYNDSAVDLVDGIVDEYVSLLKKFTKEVIASRLYTAERSENELCYLYGMLAMEHLHKTFNPFADVPYKVKYDGNEWTYHGHVVGTFAHYSYHFVGFTYRPMLTTDRINVCEKLIQGAELTNKEKELAAHMIKDGQLANAQGEIKICIPAFTLSEKDAFDQSSTLPCSP